MAVIQTMVSTKVLRAFLVVLGLFLVAGCSKGKVVGEKLPGGTKVTTLAEILENPQRYDGKTVVMQGTVSGQCASLCEFFYKEGKSTVTVFPKGVKFPRIKTGSRIRMLAQVSAGSEQVVFSALGARIETGQL